MNYAPEGDYQGWHYDHSFDRPVTGRWRAERHGVGLCADNLESLKAMIRTKNAELKNPPTWRKE